ncbi:MAG TPA: M6 family metalloprotease domain-containing protein [Longimicrobium sp.]|nr:M6 family metalloprotease domain-containing protein [Longimicrobium sp.]
MSRRAALVAAAAALAVAPAAAQDIEMLSRMSGRPLPQGYYDRIRQDPDFFEQKRHWPGYRAAPQIAPGGEPASVEHRPLRGELHMVVIMALFSDSPEPILSTRSVQETLFGANPRGNLTEFYQELSGGLLTIRGTVLPWVRTSITRAETVGQSYGLGADANTARYLREAVKAVDATTNFAQYDNDGPDGIPNSPDDDGYVDLAVFQFAERAAACEDGEGMWPHRAGLSGWLGTAYATDDLRPNGHPVKVDGYHIQSAVTCDGTQQSISVLAHETGHALGLPDFYDAVTGLEPMHRRWVLGCWALMAGGSWGCGDGARYGETVSPPHMSPFEKAPLGWIEQVVAQPGWRRTYTLDPVQTGGQTLVVPLQRNYEYLMLEYRPNTGFDAVLPVGGVLVYHVDWGGSLNISCVTCPRRYLVSLVEADGDSALLRTAAEGGDRGVAGDVFTGRRTLDDRTHPSARLNDGRRSNVGLEIEVAGGQARITVSTLPAVIATEPLLAPLLGSAGGTLTADERAALDYFGNRSGGYDLGDLRTFMRYRPGVVRQTSGG